MSAYKVIECPVKTEEQIIEGLLDMGFDRSEIEVHKEAVPLIDYTGRPGKQKGNIIVRRKNFKERTHSYYNADLGFEKIEGGYKTHINSEENRWWNNKLPRFKQVAAATEVISQAKRRGYHVSKTEKNGKIKLKLIKNF